MKFDSITTRENNESQVNNSDNRTGSWLAENIWKPAYNAGVVTPVNAGANAINFVREDTVGKLTPYKIKDSTPGSLEWHAQTFSGAFAGTLPYAVAGQLAGGLARGSGQLTRNVAQRFLPAQEAMAMTLPLEKLAANKHLANVVGAIAYDGLRDTQQGETRLGNMMGGATAIGLFSFSRGLTQGARAWEKPALYFGIGSLGGTAQAFTSHLVSEGSLITKDQFHHAVMSGGWTNLALPLAHHGVSKLVDRTNLLAGRGISLDRFLEQSNYKGDSPTLNALTENNPLARIQTHNYEIFRADHDRNMVHLQKGAPIAKAGHELNHLDRKMLIETETLFVKAKEAINTPDAERLYIEARVAREIASRKAEQQIAAETSPTNDKQRGSTVACDAKGVLREIAHDGLTYEQLFRREFHEKFLPSDGNFRPIRDYSGTPLTSVILQPEPISTSGMLPIEIAKDYISDKLGPEAVSILCDKNGVPSRLRIEVPAEQLGNTLAWAGEMKWRPEIGGRSMSLDQLLAAAATSSWRPISLAAYLTNNHQLRQIATCFPEIEELEILHGPSTVTFDAADSAHIGQLKNLRHLSTPRATNELLTNLLTLPNIRSLELPYAQIDNSGMQMLGSMTRLNALSLRNSPLTPESLAHIGRLKNLTTLDLTATNTTDAGLAHLAPLKNLEHLFLASNEITDTSITVTTGMRNLVTLTLPETITDIGMAQIGTLTNLRNLDLHVNDNITDTGMSHIANLKQLEHLDLGWLSGLTNDGFQHLAQLTNLKSLDARYTNMTNEGLAHLRSLTNLQSLNVQNCEGLTDKGLNHILGLQNLRDLDIGSTAVSNKWLSKLTQLPCLETLSLSGARLTNSGLAHLQHLKNLKGLYLSNTRITGAGLASLSGMTNLQRLELLGTKTASGLKHLSGLTNLTHLNLTETGLKDSSLVHLSPLTNLRHLDLTGGLDFSTSMIAYTGKLTDAGLKHLRPLTKLETLSSHHHSGITATGQRQITELLPTEPKVPERY